MLVKKSDIKIVYDFAKNLKNNNMSNVDIDLLWFCNDVMEQGKVIAESIQDGIDSLKKWYSDNLAALQHEYSEKNEDGSVKIQKDSEGRDVVVLKDGLADEYTSKFNDLIAAANTKGSELQADSDVEVEFNVQSIKKSVLPKEMTPVTFDSIIKFVER